MRLFVLTFLFLLCSGENVGPLLNNGWIPVRNSQLVELPRGEPTVENVPIHSEEQQHYQPQPEAPVIADQAQERLSIVSNDQSEEQQLQEEEQVEVVTPVIVYPAETIPEQPEVPVRRPILPQQRPPIQRRPPPPPRQRYPPPSPKRRVVPRPPPPGLARNNSPPPPAQARNNPPPPQLARNNPPPPALARNSQAPAQYPNGQPPQYPNAQPPQQYPNNAQPPPPQYPNAQPPPNQYPNAQPPPPPPQYPNGQPQQEEAYPQGNPPPANQEGYPPPNNQGPRPIQPRPRPPPPRRPRPGHSGGVLSSISSGISNIGNSIKCKGVDIATTVRLNDPNYMRKQMDCVLRNIDCDETGIAIKTLAPEILKGFCPHPCDECKRDQINKIIAVMSNKYPREWGQIVQEFTG